MHVVSDEERREVANWLRLSGESLGFDNCFAQMLCDVAGTDLPSEDFDAAGYLAYLIDRPTCNIDVMTTDERADYECSEHIMRCLNCGAEFGYVLYSEDGDVSMDDKPNYCPHCGTRVVSDDD